MSTDNNSTLVTVTIDGKQVQVPKGTNLIEVAATAGIEIPHYCYHPHLSIAGNCRMCQVAIQGQPKLQIACNTTATEGLVVQTQFSNSDVSDAQRATLEFLLINHPLDCTVCDQAGHCKLQDYHYQYNTQGSRFIEDKVHKVKAEPLGPEVIYDGERCIMCTRCVRFCSEVTETSELGAFNRGDRGVIGVFPGKELNNPLSGSVVDLCPVGALTHRQWRFNNRYWYAKEVETICTGCSTGCSAKVAIRDEQIVQVKARLNSAVNKEWLCDEGRYGFMRFQPEHRLLNPAVRNDNGFSAVSLNDALVEAAKVKSGGQPGSEAESIVFLSPMLSMEEILLSLDFSEKVMGFPAGSSSVVMQIVERALTPTQAKLISPDYAPNARAFSLFVGDSGEARWRSDLEARYRKGLDRLRLAGRNSGNLKKILFIGDHALRAEDIDAEIAAGIYGAEVSVAICTSEISAAAKHCRVVLPGRTVNEKSGVMINRDMRLQRFRALLTAPGGTYSDWMLLDRMAQLAGKPLLKADVTDDRALFRAVIGRMPDLKDVTLAKIGPVGISLTEVLESGIDADASTGQGTAESQPNA